MAPDRISNSGILSLDVDRRQALEYVDVTIPELETFLAFSMKSSTMSVQPSSSEVADMVRTAVQRSQPKEVDEELMKAISVEYTGYKSGTHILKCTAPALDLHLGVDYSFDISGEKLTFTVEKIEGGEGEYRLHATVE